MNAMADTAEPAGRASQATVSLLSMPVGVEIYLPSSDS